MEEVEVKFLNIDVKKLEKKLVQIGAVKLFDRMYKRKVYDYPDLRLNEAHSWIRVRDEVDQVTMGFKQRRNPGKDKNDEGMDEIEVIVNDFKKTWLFLEKIGLKQKFYEENRRIRYQLGEIEFDLDFWPLLNPYLEIEAKTWAQIDEAISLLALNHEDKKICSTMQIYALSGINEMDYDELTFERQVKKKIQAKIV